MMADFRKSLITQSLQIRLLACMKCEPSSLNHHHGNSDPLLSESAPVCFCGLGLFHVNIQCI